MKTTETTTYAELAKRLNDCKLFNKAPELDPNIYDGLENGELEYCIEHDNLDECKKFNYNDCEYDYQDIYQWYLISPSDAEYLKNVTNELVFYSEVLDEYVWGVTHFGTSWDGVELEIRI